MKQNSPNQVSILSNLLQKENQLSSQSIYLLSNVTIQLTRRSRSINPFVQLIIPAHRVWRRVSGRWSRPRRSSSHRTWRRNSRPRCSATRWSAARQRPLPRRRHPCGHRAITGLEACRTCCPGHRPVGRVPCAAVASLGPGIFTGTAAWPSWGGRPRNTRLPPPSSVGWPVSQVVCRCPCPYRCFHPCLDCPGGRNIIIIICQAWFTRYNRARRRIPRILCGPRPTSSISSPLDTGHALETAVHISSLFSRSPFCHSGMMTMATLRSDYCTILEGGRASSQAFFQVSRSRLSLCLLLPLWFCLRMTILRKRLDLWGNSLKIVIDFENNSFFLLNRRTICWVSFKEFYLSSGFVIRD